MSEKLEKVKELLNKYNQEDLLQYKNIENEELLDQILKIDFEQLEKLYNKAVRDEKIEQKEIEHIDYVDKEKLSKEEKEKYVELGEKIIKEGKFAAITMAGGQGTRLGHNGPKGTYKVQIENESKSIFELLCDNLKRAYEKYNVYVNWYIMTSVQNNDDTVKFFEENNYFDYPKNKIKFFKQGELPILSEEGKLLLNKEGLLNKAADGHGGIIIAMEKSGILQEMKEQGIEWIYIGPIDNILQNIVDPLFVGVCQEKKMLAGGKSVVKAYPEEKVGVFCKKDKRPSVVEYTEISKEMSELRNENGELVFGESHINCNLFNIKAIEKLLGNEFPYHCAHKKIAYMDNEGKIIEPENINAYKFESFIFDGFEQLDDIAILRVKREDEFAPIKNAEGKDSPETAVKLYNDFWNKI